MSVAEISVVPVGTRETSVSRYVAAALKILKAEPDIKYELTAMSTIIEGDTQKILALAAKIHESAFAAGAQRVLTSVKIDERRDKSLSISGKIASVMQKLD
jgi:uncharacterized protein (TIGR00106 family)